MRCSACHVATLRNTLTRDMRGVAVPLPLFFLGLLARDTPVAGVPAAELALEAGPALPGGDGRDSDGPGGDGPWESPSEGDLRSSPCWLLLCLFGSKLGGGVT